MTSDPSFSEVVRRQRACRSFTDEPVPDEMVEQVLEAATFAPSAENKQPWVFVVVRDAAARNRIGALTRRAWEEGGRALERDRLPPHLYADVERGATGGLTSAPVLIVVAADTRRSLDATVPSSIYPAVQNLLLAATALRLGSALTTLATAFSNDLCAVLALPEHVRPVAVIPLGWPAVDLAPPRREPVAEHAHRDRYGTPW